MHGGPVVNKACSGCRNSIELSQLRDQLNDSISNLNFVTDFDVSCMSLYSSHLELLAVMCPNLWRLNLQDSVHCLET